MHSFYWFRDSISWYLFELFTRMDAKVINLSMTSYRMVRKETEHWKRNNCISKNSIENTSKWKKKIKFQFRELKSFIEFNSSLTGRKLLKIVYFVRLLKDCCILSVFWNYTSRNFLQYWTVVMEITHLYGSTFFSNVTHESIFPICFDHVLSN